MSGKRIWLCLSLFLTGVCLWGQETNIRAERFVLSNGGGGGQFQGEAFNGESFVCFWNIGEALIGEYGTTSTWDASKKRLTEGFEQGEGYIDDILKKRDETATANEDAAGFSVALYPNPTRGRLQLEIGSESGAACRLELHSLFGVKLWEHSGATGRFEIDLTGHAAGVYILSIHNRTNGKTAFFKVIKAS